jgi:hypothetical protein
MTAALALLAKIPAWVWIVTALVGWGAWGHHRAGTLADDLKATKATLATTQTTLDDERKVRDEEHRRMEAQAKVAADQARKAAEDRAAAAKDRALAGDASAAARKLLDYVQRTSPSPGPGDPTAATRGAATEALGRVAQECPREYAALADDAVAAARAGEACVGHYESLRKP